MIAFLVDQNFNEHIVDGLTRRDPTMEDVNLATFLGHPTYDDFWKRLSAEAHAEQVNAPIRQAPLPDPAAALQRLKCCGQEDQTKEVIR